MKNKIFFLLLILAGLLDFACKKNNGGGPPVITSVRAIDTTRRDSTFDKAMPGTLIVIQGNNLGGLEAVLFNDTSAYFNPVYATNTNIIVTIPATAQTAATNPNVPNVIRLVTNHGTVSYSFSLYLSAPYISSIAFNNTGTQVVISGGNFAGVTKVTFPGNDTALSYSVSKDFSQVTATIPPGTGLSDSLRVFCTFGTAAFAYPPPMTIASVSNENAPAGTTITITGTNFIGISQVIFPGNIPGTDLQVASVTQLTVTVPAGITSPDSLHLVGALGTAASHQLYDSWLTHPSPGYLDDFENQYASDNTGSSYDWTGTHFDAPTAAADYPGATGGCAALIQSSRMPANSAAGTQGNAGFVQLDPHPWADNPGSDSVSQYSLKFEVFVKNKWTAGSVWIAIGSWYGWNSYAARYAPWSTDPSGAYLTTGWVTVTIPLTQMLPGNPFYNTSYSGTGSPANFLSDYPATSVAFLLMNDGSTAVPANALNIAIDNVRIVKGQ